MREAAPSASAGRATPSARGSGRVGGRPGEHGPAARQGSGRVGGRAGGLRPLRPGTQLTVTFSAMAPDGAAVARVGRVRLAVPYGIPGETAVVEVTQTSPVLRGRIVGLMRKSPDAAVPPCPHFGRCGGCQWQHIALDGQRRLKQAMVVEALRGAEVEPPAVAPCVGIEPWTYRTVLTATIGGRAGVPVAGFHTWGGGAVVPVESCAVQHPTNVQLLHAVRDAVAALRLPPYDPQARRGLVRGVVGLTAAATGEALAVLSTTGPLPDRMAFVRALLDRVPGLVGILLTVQRRPLPRLLGPRLDLLWGRPFVREELLGVRWRLDPRLPVLPSPRALELLFETVREAARLRGEEQVLEAFAEGGVLTLALAACVRRAVGVVADREAMTAAWATAAANGIANAVFYTRDPGRVLVKLHRRGERSDVLVLAPPGAGLPAELGPALQAAGPPRLVYVARSLRALAEDLRRLRGWGYAAGAVRPLDLFPQTSHVHTVVALERR